MGRTVTFQSVLHGAARLTGQDPSRTFSGAVAATLVEFINERMREAWDYEFWPDWVETEQRAYRAAYASGSYTLGTEVFFLPDQKYYIALQNSSSQDPATLSGTEYVENSQYWAEMQGSYSASDYLSSATYAVGDRVYYPVTDRFYQCIQASTGNVPTNASYWGPLVALRKYVDWEQTGKTVIHRVEGAYARDPRVFTTRPSKVRSWRGQAGLELDADAPSQVWLRFMKPAPEFTSEVHSLSTTYALGALVYSTSTGECYKSLQGSNLNHAVTDTSWWEKQDVPYELQGFIKRAAAADMLREQKQDSRAVRWMSQAYDDLNDMVDRVLGNAGSDDRVSFTPAH